MPNWCEGTLKIRGSYNDIARWCKDNLHVYRERHKNGDWETYVDEDMVTIEETDEITTSVSMLQDAYIEGTNRHFVQCGFEFYADENGNSKVAINIQAAWNFESEPYLEMAKKYNLDFRFYGFESGMQFNREVVIENGELLVDNEIEFDDYFWECPCPTLGG